MTCPDGLGDRGRDLWSAVESAKPTMSPGDRELLHEACRLVDRLDRFDALISGATSEWASVDWPFEDAPATLVISSVVSEARQHAAELRQIVKALNIPEAAAGSSTGKSGLALLLGGAG